MAQGLQDSGAQGACAREPGLRRLPLSNDGDNLGQLSELGPLERAAVAAVRHGEERIAERSFNQSASEFVQTAQFLLLPGGRVPQIPATWGKSQDLRHYLSRRAAIAKGRK